MKNVNLIISLVILIAVLVFGVWGIFIVGKIIIVRFSSVNTQILTAIIATSGTIIVGIVAVIIGQQITKKREIQESHRPHKIKIYEEFMEKLTEMLEKQKQGKASNSYQKSIESMAKHFVKFTREMILWGSPRVIRSYTSFREMGTLEGKHPEILLKTDDMFREFRKDLGNSNRGLRKGELIKLFLSDPEKIDILLTDK